MSDAETKTEPEQRVLDAAVEWVKANDRAGRLQIKYAIKEVQPHAKELVAAVREMEDLPAPTPSTSDTTEADK